MNDLIQGENEMREALDRLSRNWAYLSEEWDDSAKRHFESAYVIPTLAGAPSVLEQLQQLGTIIEQARMEVE
jgi:hypothetical protein